jgi:hypothetical protein
MPLICSAPMRPCGCSLLSTGEWERSRPDHHECHHMISINRQDQAGTSGAQIAQRSPMGATSIILS